MSTVDVIKESISELNAKYKSLEEESFSGSEDDYTFGDHQKLFGEVIKLLRAAVRKRDLLIQEFSPQEINLINRLVINLTTSPEDSQYLKNSETRALISRMRVVFGRERGVEYAAEMNELQSLIKRTRDMVKNEKRASAMVKELEGVQQQLANIADSENQAQQELQKVENLRNETENKSNTVGTVLDAVKDKRAEVDTQSSSISNLFTEITKKKEEVEKLIQDAKEFSTQAEVNEDEYRKKRDELLAEAEDVLVTATAAGLAGAFEEKIKGMKTKLKVVERAIWLICAGGFIGGAVGIGIWFYVTNDGDITLENTLARASITILPIFAAWFCTRQYSRLERTTEDYEYKKALAQSMPVFMKKLKPDSDEYRMYLFSTFQQMLKDPLRNRHDDSSPLSELFDKIKVILRPSKNKSSDNDKSDE